VFTVRAGLIAARFLMIIAVIGVVVSAPMTATAATALSAPPTAASGVTPDDTPWG
jgi:hypothetical protein